MAWMATMGVPLEGGTREEALAEAWQVADHEGYAFAGEVFDDKAGTTKEDQ